MKPVLLAMKGPMGMGKSATSWAVGQMLKWPVIDKDDVSDVLLDRLDDYSAVSYDVIFNQAEALLTQRFNVILDSPFRGGLGYEKACVLAERLDVDLRIIECCCSDRVLWANRIANRVWRPTHSKQLLEIEKNFDFESYQQKVKEDFAYEVTHPLLKVDTSTSFAENLDKIVHWISN